MRKTGKVLDYTPYEEVKDKDGNAVVSKMDGLPVMKRSVVVDCNRTTDEGDEITERFVCDMYREEDDDRLEKLRTSGTKMAFYINFDYGRYADGRYFQKVTLRKISELTA